MTDENQERPEWERELVADYDGRQYPHGEEGERLKRAITLKKAGGVVLILMAGAVLYTAYNYDEVKRLFASSSDDQGTLETGGAGISTGMYR